MDYREAEQRAPLKRVWKGMIPIELQLAASDAIELLASAVLPEPFQTFYMLIPRVGYLPFISPKIKERWLDPMLALARSDQEIKESDIWFEYKGQALKWHYPIGLLYDMLVTDIHKGDAELPWSLTLHVRKLPTAKVIAQPHGQLMRDMFMAMIKEADFTRNGSTKRVMDLAKSDQMQLLDGLESHTYEKYFAIHSILIPPSTFADTRAPVSSSSTASSAQKNRAAMVPKAIPVRFYMQTAGSLDDGAAKDAPTGATASTTGASSGNTGAAKQADITQFHVSQVPIPLYREGSTSELATLADAFKLCYGITDQTNDAFVTNCVCISHGVCVPWESPISWLAEHFFYADCFLHMVVISV
ncbi:autophagy protein 5 [Coemansia sp. RSA 2050]|nr:autophagy protein 5 [Coemansia sp. RSA 2050]KAJ2729226.1 autophagy protein 5 [Coemansia sp. BCRC 34962]